MDVVCRLISALLVSDILLHLRFLDWDLYIMVPNDVPRNVYDLELQNFGGFFRYNRLKVSRAERVILNFSTRMTQF